MGSQYVMTMKAGGRGLQRVYKTTNEDWPSYGIDPLLTKNALESARIDPLKIVQYIDSKKDIAKRMEAGFETARHAEEDMVAESKRRLEEADPGLLVRRKDHKRIQFNKNDD